MPRKPRDRTDDRPRTPMDPLAPMRPDATVQRPLPLEEVPTGPEHARAVGLPGNIYFRRYRLGQCTVAITRTPELGFHLSIAHHARYPTWDEIAQARYRLLPADRWFAMYLPPPEQYTNLHRNCFQLLECRPPTDGDGPWD